MAIATDRLRSQGVFAMDAAGQASGMAFVTGELERLHPEIIQPLASTTWPRDIFCETGGGFADISSHFFAQYASAAQNEWGIVSGKETDIPVIQGNI